MDKNALIRIILIKHCSQYKNIKICENGHNKFELTGENNLPILVVYCQPIM